MVIFICDKLRFSQKSQSILGGYLFLRSFLGIWRKRSVHLGDALGCAGLSLGTQPYFEAPGDLSIDAVAMEND